MWFKNLYLMRTAEGFDIGWLAPTASYGDVWGYGESEIAVMRTESACLDIMEVAA